MNTSKELIGIRIKMIREQAELTQQQLANRLETDRQYVWKLENGKINLTADYLDFVLDKLECTPEKFWQLKIEISQLN